MDEFDPIDTQAQQEQADIAQKRAELRAKQVVEDFMWLMRDPRGRRIVWAQLADAGVFQPVFSNDAMLMAFNEGRRGAGLRILAQVHSLCPDLYVTMMKEQQQ